MSEHEYIKELEHKINNLEEELTFKEKEVEGLKGAFLANVSHEIRTPMNAIVGFSGLLKEDGFTSEERSDFIDEIILSSRHLTELIEDIIEVSSLQFNKKKQSKKEIIDPYQLLFDIFEEFQLKKESLLNREIELKLKTNKDALNKKFISNPKILNKILKNLIDNAFKFTEKGTIELSIVFHKEYIEFIVSDTGIGIAESKLSCIYNNFSKVWKKNGEVLYDGLGIGLSSAKNFIDILGGAINVQSEEGFGSSFSVYIPYTNNSKPLKIDLGNTKLKSKTIHLSA